VLKHRGKSHKAVGSIIAILFIISAIVIAFALIEFGLMAQQKQAEIHQKTYEAQAKAADVVKAVDSIWFYEKSLSVLTINITNNFAEPVTITGIAILYSDGVYEVLKEDLSTLLGTRLLSDPITLPHTLMPGEMLTVKLVTLEGKAPVAVRVATVAYQVVVASSAKQYIPTNITATVTPIYKIVLAPAMFGEGTVTTKGYGLEAQQILPSEISAEKGISEGNIVHIISPNDGLTYNVTSIKEEKVNWLNGWNHRRPVTITNTLAQTLENFQVRIELNSAYAEVFENTNPDGSDIRFTLSDGVTKIPYWIEEWDSVSQNAIIWVKVPQIPANGETTIYMYYGNPTATSESNGDEVFELFEDFEDNAPTWTINNDYGLGNGLWHITNVTEASYKGNSLYFGNDSTLNYDGAGVAREGVVDTPQLTLTSGYNYELMFYTKWGVQPWKRDILTVEINGEEIWEKPPPAASENWYLEQLDISEWAGQTIYVRFHFRSDRRNNRYFGWAIDNVIVRKVVSPEPYVSIGSRESLLYISQVKIRFSGIPADTKRLDFTIRLRFNVSNVNVEFRLWNGSGWDLVEAATVGDTYSDVSFSTLNVNEYVIDDIVSLSINVTHDVPFKEFIDYVGLGAYTLRTVIYIGAGGSNSIYKYILETGQFSSEVIRAEYGGAPIIFDGMVSMDYDVHRDFLWVVNGSTLYYYDIVEKQWVPYVSLPENVSEGCSLIYFNNKTYIFIGGGSSILYVYDLSSGIGDSVDLGFSVGEYSVVETDGSYIYVLAGGGSVEFYRIDPSTLTWTRLSDAPTAYAVGLAYDGDGSRLWLIGRGGGIHYYDIVNDHWEPYQQQIPYTPQSQGNRLEYYDGKLYHVRNDYTRELWIIDIST